MKNLDKKSGLKSNQVMQSGITIVPRESLRHLAKIVNTPEGWSVYNQMWQLIDRVDKNKSKTTSFSPSQVQEIIAGTIKEVRKNDEDLLLDFEVNPEDVFVEDK